MGPRTYGFCRIIKHLEFLLLSIQFLHLIDLPKTTASLLLQSHNASLSLGKPFEVVGPYPSPKSMLTKTSVFSVPWTSPFMAIPWTPALHESLYRPGRSSNCQSIEV